MEKCPKCETEVKYSGFSYKYPRDKPPEICMKFYCPKCDKLIYSPPITPVEHSQIQKDPDLVKKRVTLLQLLDQKIDELGELLAENVNYLTAIESSNMNKAVDEELYYHVRFLINRNNPEPGSRICTNCGITDEDCSNILEFDKGEFLCCACAFYVGVYWCSGQHKSPRETSGKLYGSTTLTFPISKKEP